MNSRHRFFPVIHVIDEAQATTDAKLAADAGAHGVFLIDMNNAGIDLIQLGRGLMFQLPDLKIGINHLNLAMPDALARNSAAGIHMTWSDHAGFRAGRPEGLAPLKAKKILDENHAGHELFAGVGFKYQAHDPDELESARAAAAMGFTVTTSGSATGSAPNPERIARFHDALHPAGARLAIASGMTPDNVKQFAPYATDFLVATGISTPKDRLELGKMRQFIAAMQGTEKDLQAGLDTRTAKSSAPA